MNFINLKWLSEEDFDNFNKLKVRILKNYKDKKIIIPSFIGGELLYF